MNALNVKRERKQNHLLFLFSRVNGQFYLTSCPVSSSLNRSANFPPRDWYGLVINTEGSYQAYNPAVFIKVSIYELEMGTENIPLKS